MKCAAKPGPSFSNGMARCHLSCTMAETAKPRSAYSIAGASTSANGKRPRRPCSSPQPATAPGTVTVSQPRTGRFFARSSPYLRRKYSSVHAAGAVPLEFSPSSCLVAGSHTMAKLSAPSPLLQGSVIVMTAAAATAASAALPPACMTRNPAWAASGWLVATMLRAKTGVRTVGYGLFQSNVMAACIDAWGFVVVYTVGRTAEGEGIWLGYQFSHAVIRRSLISLAHFALSLATTRAKSAGEPPAAS